MFIPQFLLCLRLKTVYLQSIQEKNKDFFNLDSHFSHHINIVGCSTLCNEHLFAISVTIGTRVQYFYEL